MKTEKEIIFNLMSFCVQAVFKLIMFTEIHSGIQVFNIKAGLQWSSTVTNM